MYLFCESFQISELQLFSACIGIHKYLTSAIIKYEDEVMFRHPLASLQMFYRLSISTFLKKPVYIAQ